MSNIYGVAKCVIIWSLRIIPLGCWWGTVHFAPFLPPCCLRNNWSLWSHNIACHTVKWTICVYSSDLRTTLLPNGSSSLEDFLGILFAKVTLLTKSRQIFVLLRKIKRRLLINKKTCPFSKTWLILSKKKLHDFFFISNWPKSYLEFDFIYYFV